jgi:hypothetical protein
MGIFKKIFNGLIIYLICLTNGAMAQEGPYAGLILGGSYANTFHESSNSSLGAVLEQI